LSADDRERGGALLRALGVPDGAWHVALHVREPGFWKQIDGDAPTGRDASIETYYRAIRAITERGGWVIRLGDASMRPLPSMERVVDYAHSAHKSEWADVFLAASCRFFVATNSGLGFVPAAFGVPVAWTNWSLPGVLPWYGNGVWIPKMFVSKSDGRHLAFPELFETGLAKKEWKGQLDSQGVSIADNTPEEIDELVLEMLEAAEGTPRYSADDESVQERFAALAHSHGCYTAGRLGRGFMRKHADMLGTPARARQPA
jgi:putative glycosyltransferase (TIGR04372 family)